MTAPNDAAFLRMFLLVLGALVIFTIAILVVANIVTAPAEPERGEDPRQRAAISERIAPVGRVNVAAVAAVADQAAATDSAAPRSGKAVVTSACASCHVAGILESPKIGDEAAWSQRLDAAGGLDGLTTSAINGKGLMPARGGAAASDAEIRAAVVHMLAESGIDVAATDANAAETDDDAGESGATAEAADSTGEAIGETVAAAAPRTPTDTPKGAAGVPLMAGETPRATGDAATASSSASPGEAAPGAPATATAPAAAETPSPAEAPAFDLAQGKAVYDSACFACHAAGVAGAPKLGDEALWAPRIAQGYDALIASAINGKGAMPPKGGRVDLDEAAIRNAVGYMVDAAQ